MGVSAEENIDYAEPVGAYLTTAILLSLNKPRNDRSTLILKGTPRTPHRSMGNANILEWILETLDNVSVVLFLITLSS